MADSLFADSLFLFDAHCHFHLTQTTEAQEALDEFSQQVFGLALMSTQPKDWAKIIETARRLKKQSQARIHFALGVHPWFAHLVAEESSWLDRLRALLAQYPLAIIGEIGLDRRWIPPDTKKSEYQSQRDVFTQQMALASELQRPVSLHCVHAQGDLFNALRQADQLPPKIYLHAFGGAPGTVEQLIRDRHFGDRLYFGFASCINLRSPKVKAVIKAVPSDRLLIESDRSSAYPVRRIQTELINMLEVIKEQKEWKSLEKTAEQLKENANHFYGFNSVLLNELD